MTSSRTNDDRHALAVELAGRCAPLLSPHDWEGVSSALGEMHEHLREDLPDEGQCNEVFGDMIANLIERLGNPEIASWAQVHVYRRSANGTHRERAALWLRRHQH